MTTPWLLPSKCWITKSGSALGFLSRGRSLAAVLLVLCSEQEEGWEGKRLVLASFELEKLSPKCWIGKKMVRRYNTAFCPVQEALYNISELPFLLLLRSTGQGIPVWYNFSSNKLPSWTGLVTLTSLWLLVDLSSASWTNVILILFPYYSSWSLK